MAKKTNINKCSYIDEEKLFLCCECNSEILVLSPDFEDKEIYCSIYRYRYLKPGLKHRLHHCWHILKTGSPYEDEIILSKKRCKKIKRLFRKIFEKNGCLAQLIRASRLHREGREFESLNIHHYESI